MFTTEVILMYELCVCHVAVSQQTLDSLYKSAHVHRHADVAVGARGRSQGRPGTLARVIAPLVERKPGLCYSAFDVGRHDAAITQHGRLQQHEKLDRWR